MTPNKGRGQWARATLAFTSFGILLIVILRNSVDGADILDARWLNILASSLVLINGLAVLRVMWTFEIRNAGAPLPFAWSYFAIQHLAFGFGGFLVSISNQDYLYENDYGSFPWSEAILPLLLLHFVCMNAGLAGVWLGTRRRRPMTKARAQSVWNSANWSWEVVGPVCLVSIFFHGIIWLFLVDSNLGFLTYVVQALSYCANAAFLLWGLTWRQSPSKRIFLAYMVILTALEMIRGNRTFFALPILLFGIGLFVSYSDSRMEFRGIAMALPFALILAWGFVKSEDVRELFSRGNPVDTEEAMARAESLTGSDSYVARDALGRDLTSVFRVGARLFELSAADVATRTPSAIPFWGWSEDDWYVMGTGFLPLKLNSDAGTFTVDNAGNGYLREYGWRIEGLEGGTSMPATLAGDVWRRFGWAGVIVTFLIWSWFLSKMTIVLRFGHGNINMALFSAGILANTAFYYTTDMTSLITSMPRRLIVVSVYAAITIAFSKFIEMRRNTRTRGYSVALPS